jgi:hypothetical protein
MKQSIQDKAIDLLKQRMLNAQKLLKEQYRGVRPFRKEPPSEREALYYYLSEFTPQREFEARQFFGDDIVSAYVDKMERLRRKYNA